MKLLNILLIFSLYLFALFYNTQSSPTYLDISKISKRTNANVVNDLGINPDPKNGGISKIFDSKTLIDPNKVHEPSVKP